MRPPRLMTLPETANRVRITQRTLLSHIAAGRGPAVTKIGGRTLIREDHFQEWLEKNVRNATRTAA